MEQTDPDVFYSVLAMDSVRQLASFTPLAGKVVLDVGCGPGYFAAEFQRSGARYIGLDPNAGDFTMRSKSAVRASGASLPFADAAIDICYSSNVLEHVADPFAVLGEMIRVTRPGGITFASFTPWFSPWGGHETAPWHYLGGHFARCRYRKTHGREPKNSFGSSLFAVHIGDVLRWQRHRADVKLVRAFPRYHPGWAQWVVRVPLLREVVSWNLAIVLRRTA